MKEHFKHVHKCERCGGRIGLVNIQHYGFCNQFLWNIGWGPKHWRFKWTCPYCGNSNNTLELSVNVK